MHRRRCTWKPSSQEGHMNKICGVFYLQIKWCGKGWLTLQKIAHPTHQGLLPKDLGTLSKLVASLPYHNHMHGSRPDPIGGELDLWFCNTTLYLFLQYKLLQITIYWDWKTNPSNVIPLTVVAEHQASAQHYRSTLAKITI